jgi:Ca2+-binding EF-hand superfamily protein
MSEPNPVYNAKNHYGLPSNIAQEAYGSFMEFDLNRNGSITPDEMKECLRRANVQFQDADIDQVLRNQMDLNNDGKVSLEEYMKFVAAIHRDECKGFLPPVNNVKQQ